MSVRFKTIRDHSDHSRPFETIRDYIGISKDSELQKPDMTSPVIIHLALYNLSFLTDRGKAHMKSASEKDSPQSHKRREEECSQPDGMVTW